MVREEASTHLLPRKQIYLQALTLESLGFCTVLIGPDHGGVRRRRVVKPNRLYLTVLLLVEKLRRLRR